MERNLEVDFKWKTKTEKNQGLEAENHRIEKEHHLELSRLGSSRSFFWCLVGTFIRIFSVKNNIFRWEV